MSASIKIDDELESRVRRLADRRRKSAGWIMHEAIAQYVAREEAREAFVEEAVSSWSNFRSDGRHLTGDETRDWLRGWGTPDETIPPACHD